MKKSTQFTIAGTVALTCLVANPVLAATVPPLTVPVQASQTTAVPQREVVFVTTTGQELARTTITATATGWPDLRLVTGSPTGAGDYQLPSGYVYGGRRIPADPLNCDAIGGTDYVTLTPAGDPEPYLVRRANFHLVDYLTNELISHQSYFGPANQQVWAVLPAGYHWADPTLAAEGLFLTASAAEDHGNLQELVVVKDAPAEPGQHPDSGAPEQPDNQPDSGAPAEPGTTPGQQPDSGAPAEPGNQPDQHPDSGAPEQPNNQPDQKPDSGAPEQPDSQPDQKPDSGVPEQPDNQPDQKPDSGVPEQPDNQPDQKPDSGAPEQPGTTPDQKPDGGATTEPGTEPDQKPDSGAPNQPDQQPDQHPDSGAPNQPDQQPDQKPDGGAPAEPGTTPDQQPEGDGQPQQPGNPTGPSAAPGPATPPRQTKEGALGPVAPSSPGVPVDSATANRLVDGLLDAGVAKDAPAALPQTGDRDRWGLAMLGWFGLLGLGGRVLRRPKDQN